MTGAPCAQILPQAPQPIHASVATLGFPSQCCSIFPALEPHPIPIFLIVPPKPAVSCPLKCVREINTSASMIAEPIFASFTYSPLTGTSVSSVPFKPICDQHMTSGLIWGKPIHISGFQMIQCILSASNIKCITIC